MRDQDWAKFAGLGGRRMCGTVLTRSRRVDIVKHMNFVDDNRPGAKRESPFDRKFGRELRQNRAQWAVALTVLAAIAAGIGWALPKGAAAGDRVQAAMRSPATEASRVAPPWARAAVRVEEADKARGKASCAECGVIESVQRIETRMAFTGWCDAVEIARTQTSGSAFGRDFRGDRESLPETVAAAIAAVRDTTKDAVTTRHRIVVRLRDGRRQVFDEAAPRMVHVGDRIVVIAGAPRTSG